ncbi:MAG: type IX secretion system protein PorQ [Bacteroidales bacterium]|nr:type IX secretion system protein PorQ [Bacteroidales bacterium]
MTKKTISFLLIVFFPIIAFAQSGGLSTYKFLNLSNSSRIAALGGSSIAIMDNDINLAIFNPSLINKGMDNNLSLSFIDYFSGINYGFASYSKTFEKYGSFVGAIQFIDYGKFVKADETGEIQGQFSAGEYAFIIGWGRQLDSSFSIGANLKNIYSDLYTYKSYGLAADLSATYYNKEHEFATSLIAKNIGRQITKYSDGDRENLPFEIQLSMSKKLAKAPIRFILVGDNLQKYDLTYIEPQYAKPTTDPLTGELLPEKKFAKHLDKFFRHLIIGAEFTPSKHIGFSFAYNYRRSMEMRVPSKVSTIGLSWGINLKISKFRIGYSRSAYHLAGSPNHITVTTNLSDFVRK